MGIEEPVTIHATHSIPWQKRYLTAFLRGFGAVGIRACHTTVLNDLGPGTHMLFGPNSWKQSFAKLTFAKRDFLTVNRAFMGSVLGHEPNPYVAIGWNGYNNKATFAFDYGDELPHSRVIPIGQPVAYDDAEPWRNEWSHPALILGEYDPATAFYSWARSRCEDWVEGCVFRPHPSRNDGLAGVNTSQAKSLKHAIERASVVLTHHSTAACEALLRGVPVISYDEESMCWPVTPHELNHVGDRVDRHEWMEWLAWTQWNIEEIARGEPWEWLSSREDSARYH